MDKDGVEDGDQGKNRAPHDHNRDYGEGIYTSVRAIRDLIEVRYSGTIDVAFDVHCPWIAGKYNEHIYFVGTRDQETWRKTTLFAEILERSHRGPLAFEKAGNLPFGRAWNVDSKYLTRDGAPLPAFGKFLDTVPGPELYGVIEFPYATVNGAEVNPESARAFGYDLAHAIELWLWDGSRPLTRRP